MCIVDLQMIIPIFFLCVLLSVLWMIFMEIMETFYFKN